MSFAEILGQEPAIKLLKNSLERGKVAHAYLFYGIEGIGKEKTARALARALNCLSPQGIEACSGECRSCLKMESGAHPDLIVIKPSGAFIRIEQIRSLQRRLIYKPLEGRYRIVIITNADLLNKESANCLLKTLEEPPDASIIILMATDINELLPTIVSRCQAVPFRPLSPAVISEYLCSYGDNKFSPEQAALLASLSGGSLGRAVRLADSPLMEMRRDVCIQLISLSRQDMQGLLLLAENLAGRKEELPEIISMLRTCLRDSLFLRQGLDERHLINKDLREILFEGARRWTEKEIIHGLELLHSAEQAVTRNYNRQLILENLFLQLAH
jgi:DNA polymerase-3 subunit delta'